MARKLTWGRTWDDRANDWSGRDPYDPRAYCRVYKQVSNPHSPPWFWVANCHVLIATGRTDTAREAVTAAEAAYWAHVDRRSGP